MIKITNDSSCAGWFGISNVWEEGATLTTVYHDPMFIRQVEGGDEKQARSTYEMNC